MFYGLALGVSLQNLHELFSYTVITESNDEIASNLTWDEVESLCESIGEKYIDILPSNYRGELIVTIPVLNDFTIKLLRLRTMASKAMGKGFQFSWDWDNQPVSLPAWVNQK